MNHKSFRNLLLVSVMATASFAIACGVNPDGKYQDADNAVSLELKDGKASLNFGGIHIDGAYKVDGNKITISPLTGDTRQTVVFTINSDGSLDAPAGSLMPKLLKAK